MRDMSILVVDDERNIRMTMSQSLEPLGLPVLTAVNGEEALGLLRASPCAMVFLDLKLPGMDGLEVLRRIGVEWPGVRVIIITAHGTVATAVEAMKLGAVDFLQKPFTPGEIRELARTILEREALHEGNATDYRSLIELAKRHITNRDFSHARETVHQAVAMDPAQAEAYNLLGALSEIAREHGKALGFYRAALDIDPTFKPAQANLERATTLDKFGAIVLGEEKRDGSPGDTP